MVGLLGLIVALGAGAYAVGQSESPTAADAAAARRLAFKAGFEQSQRIAEDRGRAQGMTAGLHEGRRDGEAAGNDDGSRSGSGDAASEIESVQPVTPATPEEACAGSINDPGAYGLCLEQNGQDPGAPLTDYCTANPEIVASAGFCPSLNE
jgi:hypothetical protein